MTTNILDRQTAEYQNLMVELFTEPINIIDPVIALLTKHSATTIRDLREAGMTITPEIEQALYKRIW